MLLILEAASVTSVIKFGIVRIAGGGAGGVRGAAGGGATSRRGAVTSVGIANGF
ncbi:hypothetical protein LBWT_50850 [Leptolyngbya boryana IAM M-101]|nr:hypothetical protein LBWT_50850 [Leptolyngbya boryana IAM M-101]BAS65464.1 hypothetical protein LBDG_50850 [Leptolyngbya boryana dg5]